MHSLERYLRDLHDIRSTGGAVKETSYCTPLANLLNAVGQTVKPRVRCVINLKNVGAGIPDGGLFTPEHFQKGVEEPLVGQLPACGKGGDGEQHGQGEKCSHGETPVGRNERDREEYAEAWLAAALQEAVSTGDVEPVLRRFLRQPA